MHLFTAVQVLMARHDSLQLGRWTVARLTDGTVRTGVLYTMDPESGHVALLRPAAESTFNLEAGHTCVTPLLLFSSSIAQIVQPPPEPKTVPLEAPVASATLERVVAGRQDQLSFEPEVIEARREALVVLLRSQRIPFEETAGRSLLILGCLRIVPPYVSLSCSCENEIVLDRFLGILDQNPLPGDNGRG